jgi:hypothetical protein
MRALKADSLAIRQRSVGGQRRAGGTDQPIRLLQHIGIRRLLPGKETDRDKQRAEHQPDQHDLAVGAPVGVVK